MPERLLRSCSTRAGLLAASLALAACSHAPGREIPAVVSAMPEAFPRAEAGDYRPAAWWRDFEDATLNALVDEALADNLDIAAAAARVERARAQARVQRAALLPGVQATGGASYSDSPLDGTAFGDFGGGGGGGPTRFAIENYSLGLGASYEVDFFGRVRNDYAAARANAEASAYDYQAVQLATAADTIATYFEIVDARRQIALTLATAEVLGERAERTDERYARGLVQSFEVYQVRQDLRNTQASLPLRESALRNAEGRLALLLQEYPEALSARLDGALRPRLAFAPIPAGLPSDLLTQRPDVAAAWQRLEAARLTIGARRADRFPSLSLSGSIGTQGGDPAATLDFGGNWALSLASNIVAPIFDAGRISANIAAARASYDEAAATYARTVLNAYREVQFTIADHQEQRQRYRLILAQLEEAEASLDLASRRFEAGVDGYLPYLDALRAVYQVRANLSAAARDVAVARLSVHRALGGDWTGADRASEAATGEPREPSE